MSMIHSPFQRALKAAGSEYVDNVFTYQDYLYEMYADGYNQDVKPVSERQWEMICDMKGKRDMYYASNSKTALENVERKNDRT